MSDLNDELEALVSIFGSDCTIQPGNHNSQRVSVKIEPVLGGKVEDNHIVANLRFAIPLGYPHADHLPHIQVQDVRGMPVSMQQRLVRELEQEALLRVGNSMIYDLCMCAQSFLQAHNKPVVSLHEARLRDSAEQQRRLQETLEEARRVQEKREHDELKNSIRSEMLQDQNRTRPHTVLTTLMESSERSRSESFSVTSPNHDVSSVPKNYVQFSQSNLQAAADPMSQVLDSAIGGTSRSRYQTDFEELSVLGRGGFGEVRLCRNRIDDILYAIKIIRLPSAEPKLVREILHEARTLSRLQHHRIVQYKYAWIEGDDGVSKFRGGLHDDVDDEQSDVLSLSEGDEYDDSDWTPSNASDAQSDLSDESLSDHDSQQSNNQDSSQAASQADEADDDLSWGSDGDDDKADREAAHATMRQLEAKSGARVNGVSNSSQESSQSSSPSASSVQSSSESADPIPDQNLADAAKPQIYLFILMEYCSDRTVRKAIDDEHVYKDIPRVWAYLRHTLEGFQYIHSKSIVHRDIKPVNLFIDQKNEIKVGDFGLATTAARLTDFDATELPDTLQLARSFSGQVDSVGTDVGTPMYRPPESANSRRLDSSADMYALGIVLYELVRPFGTATERLVMIGKLRETGNVPDDLRPFVAESVGVDQSEKLSRDLTDIIEWLCQHDPAKRPSAVQLLHSGLIPASAEDEYMSKAVEAVANRNPAMVERLMRSMFGAANPTKLDFVYDAHTAALMSRVFSGGSFQSSKSAVLMSRAWNQPAESLLFQRMWQQHIELRMTVQDRIRVVFNRHRAVQLDAPLLMPKPVRQLATLSTAFPLLDARGNIVILPVSDMIAFARHCAHQGLSNVKRFSCSKTYRRGDDNQQPRESQECNYDAVLEASSSPAEVAFAMAETFAIVREIIAELAPLLLGDDVSPRRFCIRFNHLALLDAFIDSVLLTIDTDSARELPRLRAEVYSELAKSWRKGAFQWPQMRVALSKRFSESGLDALVTMLQNVLEKPISSAAAVTSPQHGSHHSDKTSRWASRVAMDNFSRQHDSAPSVKSALHQIHHVLECMHALGFTDDQIVFDPRLLLAPECFASNLVFTVTLCSAQSTAESMPRKSHARAKSMSAFQETASRSLTHNADIVIAEGGRYDALLSRFRLPESVFAKSLGIGFSMSIDRLVQLIHDRHVVGATQKSNNAPPTTHRATSVFGPFPPALSLAAASDSVSQRALSQSSSALAQRAARLEGRGGVLLIGAPDHDSMHDRLAIAAQLWKEDIRTELFGPRDEEAIDLMDYCRDRGLHFCVEFRAQALFVQCFLKPAATQTSSASPMLSPMPAGGISSASVPLERIALRDLIPYLLRRIRPGPVPLSSSEPKKESTSQPSPQLTPIRQNSIGSSTGTTEVEILMDERLSRLQKEKFRAAALSCVGPMLSSLQSRGRLLAIDMELSHVRNLISTMYEDLDRGGDWAKSTQLINSLRPAQPKADSMSGVRGPRDHCAALRDRLKVYCSEKSVDVVFVFSTRDNRADMFMKPSKK